MAGLREITCEWFITRLDAALQSMARDWREAVRASDGDFPERRMRAGWSRHICCMAPWELELSGQGRWAIPLLAQRECARSA